MADLESPGIRGRTLVSVEGIEVGTVDHAIPRPPGERPVLAVEIERRGLLRLVVLDRAPAPGEDVHVQWAADHIRAAPFVPPPESGPAGLETAMRTALRHYSVAGFGLDGQTPNAPNPGWDDAGTDVGGPAPPGPPPSEADDPPWLITAAHFADDDDEGQDTEPPVRRD